MDIRKTEVRDEAVWLIPASTTKIAPPNGEPGFARIFDGEKWGQSPDKRGEIWWNSAGVAILIEGLGDPAKNRVDPNRTATTSALNRSGRLRTEPSPIRGHSIAAECHR